MVKKLDAIKIDEIAESGNTATGLSPPPLRKPDPLSSASPRQYLDDPILYCSSNDLRSSNPCKHKFIQSSGTSHLLINPYKSSP